MCCCGRLELFFLLNFSAIRPIQNQIRNYGTPSFPSFAVVVVNDDGEAVVGDEGLDVVS